MGSLGSDTCPLLVILVLYLLLLLNPCLGRIPGSPRSINANFAYRLRENPLWSIRRPENLTSPWTLPADALNVSTIIRDNKPCVQINVSINSSGLPTFHGFDIRLLELSYNRFHSMRIVKRKTPPAGDLWQFKFDCWTVKPSQEISVSLLTNPDYGISLYKTLKILDHNQAPTFSYHHLEEEKRFVVSMPHSQNAYARLCYRLNVCEDLENGDVSQLFNSSHNASLSYNTVLPCLCIEVFYAQRSSKRNQICPFIEHPGPYLADLLKMSAKEITFFINTMIVKYETPCQTKPHVALCRKQNGSCMTVPDAVVEEDELLQMYSIRNIDRDPNLCFKFTILNHTLVRCPSQRDRVWNVDVQFNFFDVFLKISSKDPASFKGAICYQNQSSGICSIQSAVYNFATKPEKMELSFPWPGLGRCIKVWRSDVHFAHEYLICSFDYSHKHLGLIMLVTLLVVFAVTLFCFLIFRRIWKIFTAPLWRRTILLVYSPDSLEYKNLICAFADFLQSILGCEVILDMWDMNTVSQIGMLPWFYKKRELVSERKGKVMFVWSARTKVMYQQWQNRQLNSFVWKDPANLFGAAMSCLHKDLLADQESGTLKEYAIVYFEGLCERKDIPKSLKKISRYRLFKDLYRLISRLQDTTCLSPQCLIKAVAKYLMKKLIHSQKSQGLKHHIELCKQRLHEEIRAEKYKMELTAL